MKLSVLDAKTKLVAFAVLSLILNFAYAFYNGIYGIITGSVIFVASCLYYLLLCSMRFLAVIIVKKGQKSKERSAVTAIGVLLSILSLVFSAVIFFSISQETATAYGEITMITIATFTFGKIVKAAITAAKGRKGNNALPKAIQAIRYAEVAVSLLTMQQSMLVSFGDMAKSSKIILNAFTGAGVCLFIFLLGVLTVANSKKEKQNG